MSEETTKSNIGRLTSLAKSYQLQGQTEFADALARQASYLSQPLGAPASAGIPELGAPASSPASPNAGVPLSFRIGVSALMTFYLACLALILLPESPARNALFKPVAPFLSALGFWQSWNVFAPTIRTENFHLIATITYSDGTVELWEFPRQELLSGVEQMRAARFRKWVNDRVRSHEYSFLQPDAARYIARLHVRPSKDQAQPRLIELTSCSAAIPPPPDGIDQELPQHIEHKTFFVYVVQPEDLQ